MLGVVSDDMLSSFLAKAEATPLHHHILSCLSARQADFDQHLNNLKDTTFKDIMSAPW